MKLRSRLEEARRCLDGDQVPEAAVRSDVEIGILPPEGSLLSVDRKVAIAAALEDLLGVSRVGLVVLPEAGPFLAAKVIRGERLADLARIRGAFSRWMDVHPKMDDASL